MKKHQDYSVRRLPGPAIRPLCEGVQTPEAHHELFRDWQRTQTQSSATAPWEPEAANRCLVLLESRGHRPRGHGCAMAHPDLINARSPERANRHLCFSLDLDLHRCGQLAPNPRFAVSMLLPGGRGQPRSVLCRPSPETRRRMGTHFCEIQGSHPPESI